LKHKCFTFGYQGKSVEALKRQLQTHGALLIDIRCSPFSKSRSWGHNELRAALGDDYLWLPDLGNLNYKGGPIRIANMEKGCKTVLDLLQRRSVVLMCVCPKIENCHRNRVAGELEAIEQGLIIEEL
jgi:uncharacterized protein (DUF488 family)